MNAKRNRLLRPTPLHQGDTIGIVAPASPFDRGSFHQGVDVLQSLGFKVSVSRDLFEKEGYLAGSDDHRASLVNRFFADTSIRAVFCARGGFGSMRLLGRLDFDLIGEHPKILVGYSDITALLSAVYTRCGLMTVHGPVVTSLGSATQEDLDGLYAVLTGRGPVRRAPTSGVTLRSGIATGPVFGGNLTTLCHLVGTPYQPILGGHILLIEDRGEATYRIDRMLTQMKIAGCFDGVAGLCLGSFEDCGPVEDIFPIVTGIFEDMPIPILAGFRIGHGTHNEAIPLGVPATLDADNQSLVYHESY